MQTDRYSKIVLTIIAACLVALTINAFAAPVRAAAESITCKGEATVNGFGSTALVGGYDLKFTCQ